VRRPRLDLEGLYREQGPYTFSGGVNWVAVGAFVVAVAPNVPGFLSAAGVLTEVAGVWKTLYTYAWFVGFGLAAALYALGMRLTGAAAR